MSASQAPTQATPGDLSNCDQEPIHVPGLIQPHGALFAVDGDLHVRHVSDNLARRVAGAPRLGEQLTPQHFGGLAAIHALVSDQRAAAARGQAPEGHHAVLQLEDQPVDLLVHAHGGLVLAEIEWPQQQDAPLAYGPTLHAVMQRFRQQSTVQGLLDEGVRTLRELSGFDRVMAYRFRPDDSGDIVAELRPPDMVSYLGQRFPAGDIPAQARRLYTENTMRLIADVDAAPVPVLAAPDGAPLDMSHAVLRSVSPIHIEYLRNIDVRASMSLSIVLEGKLWGMLACHHRAPRQVPFATRAACAVLADLLSSHIQAQRVADAAAEERMHERLRARLLDRVQVATQPAQVLANEAEAIAAAFGADAVLVSNDAGVRCHGDVAPVLQRELIRWLMSLRTRGDEALLATDSIATLAPQLRAHLNGWAGLLAMSYEKQAKAGVVLLRREKLESVDWGHDPNPTVAAGPSGMRITPRGSSEVWRETVRERAEPWSRIEIEAMRQLRSDLQRIVTTRVTELERYRIAIAGMLGDGNGAETPEEATAGDRVHGLLRQVMELSLLRQGRMQLERQPLDLAQLVVRRLDAALKGHVGAAAYLERPGTAPEFQPVPVHGDPTRLQQLVDQLLDNAVRHGAMGEAVVVRVTRNDIHATLEVSNISPPIEPAVAELMFSGTLPAGDVGARAGLGYGLYLSQSIAHAHGGELRYTYEDPFVTMAVTLPLHDEQA